MMRCVNIGNTIELWHGNGLTLLDQLEDHSVDMICDDLPYGTTSCKWDIVLPFEEIWPRVKRVMKPNGAIVLFARDPFSSLLVCSNLPNYKHKWVWNKKLSGSFHLAKYQPLAIDEDIRVFSYGTVNYYPKMRMGVMRYKGGHNGSAVASGIKPFERYESDQYFPVNILDDYPNTDRLNRLHPTEKPVPLLEYLIKTYTLPGELVVDFTMGSGSTAEACFNTDRRFIGAELYPLLDKPIHEVENPPYFNVAVQRMETAKATPQQYLAPFMN